MIEKIINSLRKRLWENNNVIEVCKNEGEVYRTTCAFFDGVSKNQLNVFEEEMHVSLPEDYKQFLQLTNGCNLFIDADKKIAGNLYSLEDVRETAYKSQSLYMTIGSVGEEEIIIDSKKSAHSAYIIVKKRKASFQDAHVLHMNFQKWLDCFIVSQGNCFWHWNGLCNKAHSTDKKTTAQ
ncbi:SMI1/KNR4 family protein [Priestia sp. YIM B13446]|uniref:SMI1/KNR4 family protein n=1 Tax=Priestia TaxID=2800373 RepID=UPI000681F177|nr:SMI1/KNR4 family protein [Priestia megaterium]RCX25201.1 SMI1/KNR4 family protein SUKH-1 [Bacillus sp. AG236]TCN10919.1 SMI1/KNR4 family protein SUKH-1 [Bacillus sp. BK006]KNH21011.1 hypothetical protein ACS78_16085 [Priestia megaterium]MCM3152379.1 SMI1/KNR4 family protein [Priestia megaterium]MCU7738710.1 SMI1/KNR4 family protein [Priestia megaterium]